MIIVNILGLVLIGLIAWWFWFYQAHQVTLGEGDLVITVEGGAYSPAHLKLAAHQSAKLSFLRKDASPCAELLTIPELDISETLPLNKVISIDLPKLPPGEYAFHCQMQMYRGELKVE
jgi:plastocyanin domain-containing protein